MAATRKHDPEVILDAACRIAVQHGPRAVSVAAIAASSGAPVGSLYHQFGSRDGIVAAAWLRALHRFQGAVLTAADARPEDPVAAGTAMARAAVLFAGSHPADARLLLAVRRADLLDGADATLGLRLAELNAPVEAALGSVAQRLAGATDGPALDAVLRAVVDLPAGALRRHLRSEAALPGWLADEVAGDARLLLERLRPPDRPDRRV